eukprot:78652-Prymnesium_polylepis.1
MSLQGSSQQQLPERLKLRAARLKELADDAEKLAAYVEQQETLIKQKLSPPLLDGSRIQMLTDDVQLRPSGLGAQLKSSDLSGSQLSKGIPASSTS